MSGVLGTVTSTYPGVVSGGTGFTPSVPSVPTPSIGGGGSGIVTSALGLSSLAGALVELLVLVTVIALVGIVVIAVVANRADPDPSGRRPQTVYYFVVAFVTLTTALTGSAVFVAAVLWFTAHHSASADNGIARLMLASALITLVGAVLLGVHLRRGLVLARADTSAANPSTRVGQSYVSVVAFVSMLVVLVGSIAAIYLIFAIAAPGTFGSFGGRGWSIRLLIEAGYLVAVAGFVVARHGSLLTPGLGTGSGVAGGPGPTGFPTVGQPPVPPSYS